MQLFRMDRKKSYHSWLISYFVFVILFLLFAVVIITTAKELVKTEIIKANKEAFAAMNATCYTLKNDLDKLGIRIALDKEINAAISNSEGNWAMSQWNLRQAINKVVSHNPYIDEIAIYDIKKKLMIGGDGVNEIDVVYQDYLLEDMDYAAWQTFIQQPHKQRLYRNCDGDMLYLHSLPMETAEKTNVLICRVSKEQFEYMFPNTNWLEDRELMLIGETGRPVFKSQSALLNEKTIDVLIQKGAGVHTLHQGGQKVVAFVSESEANLICIYALSTGLYWSGLNLFLVVMVVLAAIFIVLGVVLARIFAKRQYAPVENILKLISGSNFSDEQRTDEFEYIQNTLRGILKNSKENELLKKKYQNISFRNAYVKFLREGSESVQDIFTQYNVVFDYPVYVATLLSINDFSDYFGTIDFKQKQEQELMELAITNVFDEMLGSEYHTLPVRIDKTMLFCLIGMKQESYEELCSSIGKAQSFTQEHVGIYYSALLSEPFSDLQQLQQAYVQTMDLFAWHQSVDRDILTYQDVDWSEGHYAFTIEIEQQLSESIRCGRVEEMERLLRQIFYQPKARIDSARELKFMKHNIISTFLKLLRSGALEEDGLEEQEIGALEACLTQEELYQQAKVLAEKLCHISKKMHTVKKVTLSDKVMQYVQENYADVNLNVNGLAEVFHLSSDYISKTFKQQTGEILRDYILNVRLENVERLLHSDLKLEEIANQCGFINTGTFIRTFKKNYGTTPGKYREQL